MIGMATGGLITITMITTNNNNNNRMATEGMAIMSESMEPGQGPQLGHRLPQVDDDHCNAL